MTGAAILACLLAAKPAPEPGGSTATDPRPFIDDPILMSMRPTGRSIATLRVGPSRQYTTLNAAVAAAVQLQQARMAQEGVYDLTPNYRVDVLVDPGEYPQEAIRAANTMGFYSAGGVKGDTVFMDGSLDTQGSIYWEGIDLIAITPEMHKYPVHHAALATSIFARSRLEHLGVGSHGYPTAFGMDGGYNPATTVIYDCWLGPGGLNAHGGPNSGTYPGPEHFILANTYMEGGGGFTGSTTVGSDEQWIVNSNVYDVGGSSAGGLHIGGTTVRSGTINPIAGTPVDYATDWPVPIGGLSAYWRSYWGM